MGIDSDEQPPPTAPWNAPQTILEQLREVDKSLRRCYIVQTLICLVFLYFFYNTIGAARELDNLKKQMQHAACVRDEFPHVEPFRAELVGNRTRYDRYLADLQQGAADVKQLRPDEARAARVAVPPREVGEALETYAVDVREALQVAQRLGTPAAAPIELSLDELTALTRSVRPLTADERAFIRVAWAHRASPSLLVDGGRAKALRDVLPPELVFPRRSCDAVDPAGAPARASRSRPAPEDAVAERLAAMATVKTLLGGQTKVTEERVKSRRVDLEREHGTLAEEAELAKTKLPLVELEMQLNLAFRLGPIALFLIQLLIAAYFRHRSALAAQLGQALDDRNEKHRVAKTRIHLFLLPWVLNFPYVRIPNFEGDRPRGAMLTRGVLWALGFLPVLTIALILLRPFYFGTRGQIAKPGALSEVDLLFSYLAAGLLILTLRQVLYTRRLDRQVSEAFAWVPTTATIPAGAVESRARREVRYALWVMAALLGNWSFALTPAIRIDVAVVLPLIVMVVAYRFGRTRACVLGLVVAGLWAFPRFLQETLPWWDLVYRRFGTGAVYIPHSSVSDAVRLGLLGYGSGWAFERLAQMLHERPEWQAAWAASGAMTTVSGVRPLVGIPVGVGGILVANVIFRLSFPIDGELRTAVVPVTSLAVAAALAAGWWLGARAGRLSGVLALIISFALYPVLVRRLPEVQLEFHELDHVLSFALIGYGAGRIGTLVRGALPRSARADGPSRAGFSPGGVWLLVASLCLSSMLVTAKSATFSVNMLLVPLTAALAALLGTALSARRGAWVVGAILGVLALLAPWTQAFNWDYAVVLSPIRVTVGLARWSAAAVVVLALAAWMSGQVDLAASRRARFLLAIGIFAGFELLSILRFGGFLTAYITGQVASVRIDLLTGVARLLEPWLTVVLIEAGLKLRGRRDRVPAPGAPAHADVTRPGVS